MAKRGQQPQLLELYEVLEGLVEPIDGRNTHLTYNATVLQLTLIYKRLVKAYGKPTKAHKFLNEIEWKVRDDYRVCVNKANSMSGRGMLHSIYALSF